MIPDYQFLDAVKRGCIKEVDSALASGADIHFRDFRGHSALQVAEAAYQNDMVAPLVARGADPNQKIGKRGNHLLHIAARQANIGFAYALIQSGGTVDAINNAGQTPLFIAVRHGHEYLANLLLESRADVNASVSRTGNTPLHVAARNGDKAIIRALLAKGADYSLKNKTGYLAVHEAAAAGQTEAASYLVERCHRSPGERAALLPRVRVAAELHGHHTTAEALKALEEAATISFADRVKESPRREAYKISRSC